MYVLYTVFGRLHAAEGLRRADLRILHGVLVPRIVEYFILRASDREFPYAASRPRIRQR